MSRIRDGTIGKKYNKTRGKLISEV